MIAAALPLARTAAIVAALPALAVISVVTAPIRRWLRRADGDASRAAGRARAAGIGLIEDGNLEIKDLVGRPAGSRFAAWLWRVRLAYVPLLFALWLTALA